MINRPSVSSLVAQQVPEHIRNNNEGFVTFLEAYYKYLEQNHQLEFNSIRDLDTTLDSFIEWFRKELAIGLPLNTEVDERFLLQNIKQHYLAKGSELSYKFLFKVLYNKDIELAYPSTQMLRASDGKWSQDISVFVRIEQGDPDDIIGRLVDVITPTKILRVLVDRRQYVEIEVERAIKVSDDVYEFIIDRNYFGDIKVGDRLRYRDDPKGIFFTGDILATTSELVIQEGGTGFKVGQLYNIRNFDGYGSIIKVTKVNSEGKIEAAEFIKYGIGYSTDFITTIIPQSGQEEEGYAGTTTIRVLNDLSITDRMDGFSETGTVNKYDYNAADTANGETGGNYVDGTYVGFVYNEFGISTADSQISEFDPAIIDVKLGSLARYPGYYTNNDGFLNDAIFIQDSRYYQAFSYVVKIDETLEEYRTAVKTLIHPAGLALFGEYDVRNEFDISLELESLIKILSINENDEVFTDELLTYEYDKAAGTALLNNLSSDTNIVTMLDTSGSGDTRTNPDYSMAKALYNGETDYDLNAADHSVTMDSNLSVRDFGKGLSKTSADFDGNIDDQSITMVSRDLGTNGSLSGTTEVGKDVSKPLSTIYSGITELPEATMFDGSSRFGLSIIDMDKELNDTPVISEQHAISLTMADFTDSFSLLDNNPLLFTKKLLDDTEDYDGNITGEEVILTDQDTLEFTKGIDVAEGEVIVTEKPETTMAGGLARFGLSVIDSEKELTTSYSGMSDTDAADENDLNRTTPALEFTMLIEEGANDEVTFTESGFVNKNPYGEAGFFLNDDGIYVSDNYQTI